MDNIHKGYIKCEKYLEKSGKFVVRKRWEPWSCDKTRHQPITVQVDDIIAHVYYNITIYKNSCQIWINLGQAFGGYFHLAYMEIAISYQSAIIQGPFLMYEQQSLINVEIFYF